jgi:hypothetical protein
MPPQQVYYSLQYNWFRGKQADSIPAGGEKLWGQGEKLPNINLVLFLHRILQNSHIPMAIDYHTIILHRCTHNNIAPQPPPSPLYHASYFF